MNDELIIKTTAQIASAYVGNNPIPATELSTVIGQIGDALAKAGAPDEPEQVFEPAVSVRRSIRPDHLISMIDGQPYKMLKRHLSGHGLTPEEYRERYKLPSDYPMVAPNYSETRRRLAKKIGLGRHPGAGRGRHTAQ